MKKRIFIICSVRGMGDEYRQKLEAYAAQKYEEGYDVHLPHLDTDQEQSGINICKQNSTAIFKADEIHIFYNKESQGTHFDMGVAFALNKPMFVIESEKYCEGKSFARMLSEWEDR